MLGRNKGIEIVFWWTGPTKKIQFSFSKMEYFGALMLLFFFRVKTLIVGKGFEAFQNCNFHVREF